MERAEPALAGRPRHRSLSLQATRESPPPCAPAARSLPPRPLVLTSGNTSDEPIAFEDDDALDRLAGIADAFLVHDRAIRTRVDDSVGKVVRGRALPIRRSRGYVPHALEMPRESPQPVLACGSALKNTFCLTRGR